MHSASSASPAAPAFSGNARQGSRSPLKHGSGFRQTDGPAPARVRNLPYPIARAMAAIDTDNELRKLGRSTMAVLRYIVSVADVKDAAVPTYAKKETIAERLVIGEATVYRCLSTLEGLGLITRLTQTRKARNGRMSIGLIVLSKAVAERLGLAWGGAPAASTRPRNNASEGSPSPEMIGGHIENPAKLEHLHSLSEGDSPASPSSTAGADVARVGPWRIPRELVCLTSQGRLPPPAVFRLMRECTRHGKRLADLVAWKRDRISTLRGRELFAWIRKMAAKDLDFAWLARESAAARQAAANQAAVETKVASLGAAIAGKMLASSSGRFYRVNPEGTIASIHPAANSPLSLGAFKIDINFVNAVNCGNVIVIEQADAR